MPELPEVESVRTSLLEPLTGKTIQSIEIRKPKLVRSEHFVSFLKGATFKTIKRRGKLLMFSFSDREEVMIAHLKMTGQFLYKGEKSILGGGHSLDAGDLPKLPHKHTHVIWTFTDGSQLYFNDMRQFGYIDLVTPDQLEVIVSKYGIEPGTDAFTWKAFQKIFAKRKTTIKALLLNQSVVAGLGNIYVDEVCYYARVRPDRPANSITLPEKKLLFEGSDKIIRKAIECGGTTFQYYTNAHGKQGNYRDYLQVFDKTGELCPQTGCVIEKSRVAGRGTHISPEWQK